MLSFIKFYSGFEDVEIPVRHLRQKGLLNPRFRYDNNERNTSASYDYWERVGFYMFEWPGNTFINAKFGEAFKFSCACLL